MRILQSGMEKSGNYWLYKIIQSIYTHTGMPRTTFIQTQPIHAIARTWELSYQDQADIDVLDIEDLRLCYRVSSIFRMPILDFDAYLQPATHVWTHSPMGKASAEVFSKFDKVVYIVRDPRDVMWSLTRFQFTPYMQRYFPVAISSQDEYLRVYLRKTMSRWRSHVAGHLRHAEQLGVYVIFYERLLHDFEAELHALLTYLGLEAAPELIAAVYADVKFETMHRQNPGHVRKGQANQWLEHFTPQQQAEAAHHAGKLMQLLGYPLTAHDAQSGALPTLPVGITPAVIDEAAAPPPVKFADRLKHLAKRVMP